MTEIISFETYDVRFPTSTMLDGSDAMNADPDYSAAYLRLETDTLITGDSPVFTIGRGNEVQIAAINTLAEKVNGLNIDDAFTNIGAIEKELSSDSQLRWLGYSDENLANVLMASKFNIPVFPHTGGVGLCEMVQHIAMWESVAVSGHHSDRVVEYVDHLHEHFLEPTNISRGRYMPPQKLGSDAQMHQSSINTYEYPSGGY